MVKNRETIKNNALSYLENLASELNKTPQDDGSNFKFLKELYLLRRRYLTFFSVNSKNYNYENEEFVKTFYEIMGIYDFMGLCITSEEDEMFIQEQEREVERIERIIKMTENITL